MQEVVIAGYLRTAQSRARPKDPSRDWLSAYRADDLLAAVLPPVLEQAKVKPDDVQDFLVGCSFGVSENWTYGGRLPLFLANMSERTPAKFLDQQCGSSMAGLQIGFMEIATGFADVVVVGGMEHMTRVPMGPALFSNGTISVNPRLYEEEGFAHWDMDTTMFMGLTAEKLQQQTGFSREDLDRWALRSHQYAAKAQEEDFFAGEILPLPSKGAGGGEFMVDRDQAVRPQTTLEDLSKLGPVFSEDGVITAGNSSPLNAGASAMVLMSRQAADARGVRPLAAVRSVGFVGVDPTLMGEGPVPASRMALDKAGLKAEDIDFWEINEAFCIVALNCIKQLGLDPERVNVKGGGTALGHPLGATGVRLVGTLARILEEQQARWGVANACVGGGQGVATLIERLG
ncbi:MAG: acetyl-CoA C-acetyltransferase [Desulfarculaceae bacterium]|nr:acetyl-CoA C-acetyltransferase [Desulfarculaceae bacterium]